MSTGRRTPSWALAPSAALLLALTAPLVDRAAAKGALAEVAAGARATWVAHPGRGLLRVEPASPRHTPARVPRGRSHDVLDVGRAPVAVAALHGRVWTVDVAGGTLARAEEVAGRVEVRARLGFVPADVAVSERSVWVVGQRRAHPADSVLVRVDPETARVRGVFHLGPRAAPLLALGRGTVWLAFHPRTRRGRTGLVAIEERTGHLRLRRRIGGAPAGLATGREGVWLLAQRRGSRSRLVLLDARSGTRVRAVRGPDAPGGLAASSDLVWASSLCGGPRCDVSRASVRAYDQRSGRLAAGPFRTSCPARPAARFLSGMAASGRTAMVLAGDGRGELALVIVLPRRGVLRCVPLGRGAD